MTVSSVQNYCVSVHCPWPCPCPQFVRIRRTWKIAIYIIVFLSLSIVYLEVNHFESYTYNRIKCVRLAHYQIIDELEAGSILLLYALLPNSAVS